MRQHSACIRKDDEEGSVQRLLALAGTAPAEDVQHLRSFHFARARSKLQCCALASLGPRDLMSGELLDVTILRQTAERYFQREDEWNADDSPSLSSMIVSED
ncbi:hypothetical protein WME95_41190 [Sorangium sp. So ce327]|uniref:hypothetical protein n=1 Tax=Sorangium sp. So ce327 TaxID=3133301 RepID=UPI003F61A3A7